MNESLETLRDEVFARNPGEAEFHQAVSEAVSYTHLTLPTICSV